MKQPVDLARAYLKLADRDLKAFELLIRSREIADETVGFHAQQAVEKCLKAVLAFSSIPFRKTHDLQELMDLLIDNKKTLPPNAEKLDVLNPYAVLLRYDFIDVAQGFDEPLRARLYYRCAHGRRSRLPLSERSLGGL